MSKRATAAAADADDDNDDELIPLRNWMEIEATKKTTTDPSNNQKTPSKETIIRKTTIAYGIVELILRPKKNNNNDDDEKHQDDNVIQIDNFAIHVLLSTEQQHHQPWDDIKGVSMLSPGLSLIIEEPAYLSCLLEPQEKHHDQWGRYLEVEQMMKSGVPQAENLKVPTEAAAAAGGADCDSAEDEEKSANHRCYYYLLVAKVLYELFAHEVFPEDSSSLAVGTPASTEEPAPKKAKSSHHHLLSPPCAKGGFDKAEIPFQMQSIVQMQKLGIPASICLMTQNLLDSSLRGDDGQSSSDDAYKSLRDVAEDLHLLLLDPDRFVFDDNQVQTSTEKVQLRYRKEKLYGRDREETLITDAFCRVSRGTSEAFFIGGFSGCGKSMLVNTLKASVDVVGGYVIRHKFDAVSQERSLSGII